MSAVMLTKEDREQLRKNGEEQRKARDRGEEIDFRPVVKLFTPDAQCTWLLAETYPAEPDIAFGLCDLGMGCPELGDVSLTELREIRGSFGLPVERDPYFTARKTIGAYARDAHVAQRIVT